MKNIILVTLLSLFVSAVSAQTKAEIQLKNGEIIKGKITEKSTSGLKLKTDQGVIWNLNNEDIHSMEEDLSTSKYFTQISFGMMPENSISGSFHLINGYSIAPRWDVGFGIGIEGINWNGYVPIFFTGKFKLFKEGTTPFVSVMGGYDYSINRFNFQYGGPIAGAKLGVDHFINRRFGLSTSIGYRFGNIKEPWGWWDDSFTVREMHRIEFRLGLFFN